MGAAEGGGGDTGCPRVHIDRWIITYTFATIQVSQCTSLNVNMSVY